MAASKVTSKAAPKAAETTVATPTFAMCPHCGVKQYKKSAVECMNCECLL